ncbi:hypothetical protein HNQ60_005361 [Povalibacter uvarum]|uniref:Uncharacterized protein n=1 Tax=Povalibacter uvarum TaxID=732238 RepID=A0A841HW07_9GAMM|nr:hypothetical protein [Povalibacter uvarum]MBB6096439.1 hypothetical protein [Povalibacter uvarum]
MSTCALTSADKRLIARRVGRDLIKHHGKKKSYTAPEVRKAAVRQEFSVDWHCWAYALYTDRVTFDAHHREIGETCDYTVMHKGMMDAVGGDAGSTLEVLDPSPSSEALEPLDDSWSIFDWFDWDWSDVDADP